MVQKYTWVGIRGMAYSDSGNYVSYEDYQKLEAELEQLRQQVKASSDDGWIEWGGGECPVPANALVEVRYKSGGEGPASRAAAYDWSHNMEDCYPIGAYRVVKP